MRGRLLGHDRPALKRTFVEPRGRGLSQRERDGRYLVACITSTSYSSHESEGMRDAGWHGAYLVLALARRPFWDVGIA